jgi:aspartate/methionine/tyrosine aminotransferase
MFSQRLPPRTDINALSVRLEVLRASGEPFVDLTESNPTRVGLPYPSGLLAPLADVRALAYEPHPRGLEQAREAIAADCRRRGARVSPGDVVLSASTSEAYSWLFKLLCNPGECVLVPRPSYPLFEHLTRLDGIRALQYELEYHDRWNIDFESIEVAPADTRALLVVSPNNPTGSYVSESELRSLDEICQQRSWALIVDEVFADYPLDATSPMTDLSGRTGALSFTLGGLSKSVGLPQLKLGWTVVGGAPDERAAALNALDLIGDSYLSVSTPVQIAALNLLAAASSIRAAIHDRLRLNLAAAREIAKRFPACHILRAEGGWSLVVRVPAVRSEEQLVLELLERERVLAHPGYFFDFVREAYLVVSLLPEPAVFSVALERVLRFASD